MNTENCVIKVIALDLEGTLISNAHSQFPRAGLLEFLERCRELVPRVVMYTTVPEDRVRSVFSLLVEEGHAPAWVLDIECIPYQRGQTKDLSVISSVTWDQCLLVDDHEIYITPGQESAWVRIAEFMPPYTQDDGELQRVAREIERRVQSA